MRVCVYIHIGMEKQNSRWNWEHGNKSKLSFTFFITNNLYWNGRETLCTQDVYTSSPKKNIVKEIQFKGKRIYRNYNQMNIASSKSK